MSISGGFDGEYEEPPCTCDRNNWLDKNTEFKKKEAMKTGLYECYDDYFIAYKGIRSDRFSKTTFRYQYLPGQTYESWCDCTNHQNSFGLSAGTKEMAEDYCDELVVRVKIRYEDVGRVVYQGEMLKFDDGVGNIVQTGGKIRCFKFEVLD